MFPKSKTVSVPSDAFAKEKLANYVYEYLIHMGAQKAASQFLTEMRCEKQMNVGEAPGFLLQWWCVFFDLYSAAPERCGTYEYSNEAKAFHDYGGMTPHGPVVPPCPPVPPNPHENPMIPGMGPAFFPGPAGVPPQCLPMVPRMPMTRFPMPHPGHLPHPYAARMMNGGGQPPLGMGMPGAPTMNPMASPHQVPSEMPPMEYFQSPHHPGMPPPHSQAPPSMGPGGPPHPQPPPQQMEFPPSSTAGLSGNIPMSMSSMGPPPPSPSLLPPLGSANPPPMPLQQHPMLMSPQSQGSCGPPPPMPHYQQNGPPPSTSAGPMMSPMSQGGCGNGSSSGPIPQMPSPFTPGSMSAPPPPQQHQQMQGTVAATPNYSPMAPHSQGPPQQRTLLPQQQNNCSINSTDPENAAIMKLKEQMQEDVKIYEKDFGQDYFAVQ